MLRRLIFSLSLAANLLIFASTVKAKDADLEALPRATPGSRPSPTSGQIEIRFFTNRQGVVAQAPDTAWSDNDLRAPASFFQAGKQQALGVARIFYPTGRLRGEGAKYDFFGREIPLTGFVVDDISYFHTPEKEEAKDSESIERQFLRSLEAIRTPIPTLIYVHGFNTSFSTSLKDGARLSIDTRNPKLIVFDWPGDLSETRNQELDEFTLVGKYIYMPLHLTVMYYHALIQERLSHGQLSSMISLLDRTKTVNIVAHSMGSHLLFDAIFQDQYKGAPPVVGTIFLAAPDVSKSAFIDQIAVWKNRVKDTYIYCNRDRVLIASFILNGFDGRLGECASTVEQVGGLHTKYETGVTGFLRHGYFIEKLDILDEIERLTKGSRK